MRVLITGATGLIGKEIVKICQKNNVKVNYLTTSKSKLLNQENYKGFYWNPNAHDIDVDCFKDVDAIIHLVGATISKRWTSRYKRVIISSRTETTALLVKTLQNIDHTVKQVISASAIGVYPDSLTHCYKESYNGKSASFLGNVVCSWEEAVDEFSKLDIMVSKIRIGLVLSNKGGALKEMVKPIQFGLGSAFGHGKQWQSWIHIYDLSNLFFYVLKHKIEGIYNGVAPNPVSNKALTKGIASVLNKPLFLPNTPKFIMQLVLGEMHILLFESQRVSSKAIEKKGFVFKYTSLYPALEDLLM